MRHLDRCALVFAVLCISGSAGTAFADLAPPPGYVETCTVAIQTGNGGGPCEAVDTFRGEVAPELDQALRARGLSPRCQGGGATVGTAVYCTGPAAPSTPTPSTPSSPPTPSTPSVSPTPSAPSAGGLCSVGHGPNALPSWLLVLGLVLALRRARPRGERL